MKPDQFMRWDWNEFWHAVEGLPDHVIVGYQRALGYYYQHNHCTGLRNDDEFLRKLCRIDREFWPDARAIIFDNDKFFFLDEDGLWHQKRAEEEWVIAVKDHERAVNRGKAGAKGRWG
jgi:uncharacterized protein YdaU (DUF1376 family)